MNAAAEKAEHARQCDETKRSQANVDMWLRYWTAFVANAHRTSAFDRDYAAKLDAGMARCDADRAAERGR